MNTGGADNVVVLWKKTGEGILKYTHSAPVHKLKFNPNSLKLVSCSDVSRRNLASCHTV